MASYTSYSGKKYILGSELGEGGEGIVYDIQGDSEVVAKIYKENKFKSSNDRLTMDRKLKTMIKMNIPVIIDGSLRLAWPLDILYDKDLLVGLVMPKINSSCKIYDVQRLDPCKKNTSQNAELRNAYPNYTWKYSAQFAYNLAWIVQYVHSKNIVIGDLNQNNICVDTTTGSVIIIDCDSFDITDPVTGEHFPCVVGFSEVLAPELQLVGNLSRAAFTKEADNFSLAIHIFRLLMRNADPFGGITVNQGPSSSVAANAAIINGECAYVRSIPNKQIPRNFPTLDMLPVNIQILFRKTFDYTAVTAKKRTGNRATAAEWCNALWPLARPEPNPNLQRCRVKPYHVYPAGSFYCPWCKCEQSSISSKTPHKQDPIPDVSGSTAQGTVSTSDNSHIGCIYGLVIILILIWIVNSVIQKVTEEYKKNHAEDTYSYETAYDDNDNASIEDYDSEQNAEEQQENEVYQEDEVYQNTEAYQENEEHIDVSGFIFPYSDREFINPDDLEGLSRAQISYARNEIYARRGRKFNTPSIREYFESQSWYQPIYEPEAFPDSIFNEYEKKNIETIVEYEKKQGW